MQEITFGQLRLLYRVQALKKKSIRIPSAFGQTSERGKTKETTDSATVSRQEPPGESHGGGTAAAKAHHTSIPSADVAPGHPTRTHSISLALRPITTRLACSEMARKEYLSSQAFLEDI